MGSRELPHWDRASGSPGAATTAGQPFNVTCNWRRPAAAGPGRCNRVSLRYSAACAPFLRVSTSLVTVPVINRTTCWPAALLAEATHDKSRGAPGGSAQEEKQGISWELSLQAVNPAAPALVGGAHGLPAALRSAQTAQRGHPITAYTLPEVLPSSRTLQLYRHHVQQPTGAVERGVGLALAGWPGWHALHPQRTLGRGRRARAVCSRSAMTSPKAPFS